MLFNDSSFFKEGIGFNLSVWVCINQYFIEFIKQSSIDNNLSTRGYTIEIGFKKKFKYRYIRDATYLNILEYDSLFDLTLSFPLMIFFALVPC